MSSLPRTPPACLEPHVAISQDDLAVLDLLTNPDIHINDRYKRRDAALDPLLMAAAVASGPHVTRHHYHHDFFPTAEDTESQRDWSNWTGQKADEKDDERPRYVSKQAPRSERLKRIDEAQKRSVALKIEQPVPSLPISRSLKDIPASSDVTPSLSPDLSIFASELYSASEKHTSTLQDDVHVKCMVRTRIPTPHGPAFLHLYHNNRDGKEHLAIVIDPAQLSDTGDSIPAAPYIRSRSLDAVWAEGESDMDRITRGAYVGRLSETTHRASTPPSDGTQESILCDADSVPAPLVRIHSECFTGETIGSMRCDCGEQLDEAIRQISQPVTVRSAEGFPAVIPGRGAVVYMRQEGRGIGLLSKLRAYNLQDLGHDTVTANLMLGHGADERGYEVAAAILRDLGLGGSSVGHGERQGNDGVRLLTNNPDKVTALATAGVRIVQRVPMVPRTWQCQAENAGVNMDIDVGELEAKQRASGATFIGGGVTHGEELEKYLRTKVLRMGHMLSLPPSDQTEEVQAE